MARTARVDIGGEVYHVLNRAVGRLQIFNTPADYALFLSFLQEARDMTDMRILSFVVMPNHWHLQLYPRADGDLATFMHWLTNAHTRRYHTLTSTIGTGPLYQGRYKSFLADGDTHALAVLKYIERNPVRAKLVRVAEDWEWSSAYLRARQPHKAQKLLSDPPTLLPRDYLAWVNESESEEDLLTLRASANKGTPFGREAWVDQMVQKHGLEATTRAPGRPRNN